MDSDAEQLKDVDFILTSVGWNKFHISLCTFYAKAKLIYVSLSMLVSFGNRFIPFSALRMRTLIYTNTSVLTYHNTSCHNAEAQKMNIHCSQTAFTHMRI